MHFNNIIAISLPILGAVAAPHPRADCMSSPLYTNLSSVSASTTTLSLTLTISRTHTVTGTSTTAASSTSSSATASDTPTGPFGLISSRSGSAVHLLPWTASGQRFYLGGKTATYCPVGDSCPSNNDTLAFAGTCGLDTVVPGGQEVYVAPDGSIGFTQAHSASIPNGAHLCPFVYHNYGPNTFGGVTLDPEAAFGAVDFMGCPTGDGRYQVFAALDNATVPQGSVSDCLGFGALAFNYTGSPAWQYT